MGVIQSAINQALGTAGIAARLSPGLEKRQELHKLGKQEKSLVARRDAAVESIEKKKKEGTINLKNMGQDVDALVETAGDVEQLRKRQFELDPSPEAYDKYLKSKTTVTKSKALKQDLQSAQDLLKERQQEAMIKVATKQESQLQQKDKFKNYVANLETSLGGKVKDLPENLQRAIMSQLDKGDMKKDGK